MCFLHSSRSEHFGLCPRAEWPLTYMIDIALTKEFALATGDVW
jgi:hypothetical protein